MMSLLCRCFTDLTLTTLCLSLPSSIFLHFRCSQISALTSCTLSNRSLIRFKVPHLIALQACITLPFPLLVGVWPLLMVGVVIQIAEPHPTMVKAVEAIEVRDFHHPLPAFLAILRLPPSSVRYAPSMDIMLITTISATAKSLNSRLILHLPSPASRLLL